MRRAEGKSSGARSPEGRIGATRVRRYVESSGRRPPPRHRDARVGPGGGRMRGACAHGAAAGCGSSEGHVSLDPDRERVLALVRRHGHNATCFQVLESGFSYWFDGDDACVAFVDTGKAWIVAGAPIAPIARLAAVAEGFVAAARAADRR